MAPFQARVQRLGTAHLESPAIKATHPLPNRNQHYVSRACDRLSPQFTASLTTRMDVLIGDGT
jgi:hypothetical protein